MERIIQIINHVMKEILRHENNICSKQSLTKELLQLGYELDDIDSAFQSLYTIPFSLSEKNSLQNELYSAKKGYRVFGPEEQKKLTLAFRGEIIRLTNSLLLSAEEIEQILFEAMKVDAPEVGLKDLEALISNVVRDEQRLMLMFPYKVNAGMYFIN